MKYSHVQALLTPVNGMIQQLKKNHLWKRVNIFLKYANMAKYNLNFHDSAALSPYMLHAPSHENRGSPTLTTLLPGRLPLPPAPIYFSSTINATRRLPAPAAGRPRMIPPAIVAEPHSLNDIFVIILAPAAPATGGATNCPT